MSAIEVIPVHSRGQRREFLNYPWKQYRGDPHWVPPLRLNQKELVGYAHHTFYDAAEAQTFLARRDGDTVGRVAAILNHAHNREYPSDVVGFFGFFESVDDPAVAGALFDAVRQWFAQRGITTIRGPANPSLNYECGLLIDGFDSPPTFMMTYNPPYYARLLEGIGFAKVHDMYAYFGHISQLPNLEGKLARIAEQCIERYDIKVRGLNRRRFADDVQLFLNMYNASMKFNWGSVPFSPAEMKHMATSLKFLLYADLAIVATVEGQNAGVVLCLPDYNPRIKQIDGRLLPFGFLRLLSPRRDIARVRVMAINVLPEFQRVGLGLVLMRALLPAAKRLNIDEAEFSWVLESNEMARLSLEKAGAKIYKTWRMYDWRPTSPA